MFKRYIVASFIEGETEIGSLSEIRRWTAITFKVVFGIKISDMVNMMFISNFRVEIWQNKSFREWRWKKT